MGKTKADDLTCGQEHLAQCLKMQAVELQTENHEARIKRLEEGFEKLTWKVAAFAGLIAAGAGTAGTKILSLLG